MGGALASIFRGLFEGTSIYESSLTISGAIAFISGAVMLSSNIPFIKKCSSEKENEEHFDRKFFYFSLAICLCGLLTVFR